jgi:DHA1 family bicyclomycin/chloramphenicol resistance-like MFS transporter
MCTYCHASLHDRHDCTPCGTIVPNILEYNTLTPIQKHLVAFAYLILVTGLLAMDFINPSLPYIMQSLHTNETSTKPLIVFYLFGLSISQFFYGTFSDNYGRKKTMLISYGISMAGILLSIMSGSIATLSLARFITGVGNGGATVISRAIISDVCTDSRSLKQAFSYFSVFGMMSPTFGPIIGGFIQQYTHSWRLCFVMLLCVTAASCIVIKKFMTETHVIPLVKTSLLDQGKVYLSLLKLKRFMLYNFASAIVYIFSIAYYAYMPFILFKLNFTPVHNGEIYGVYAIALILGALSLARFFNKFDSRKVFALCCFSFVLTSVLFLIYFYFSYSFTALMLVSTLIAFTCGISAPLTLSLCMHEFVEGGSKGAASSIQGFMKMFFTGVALLLFNVIPLRSMASLLVCYVVLSIIMIYLLIIFRR